MERRYRAYRCVVCGGFHLTSGRGDGRAGAVEPPKKEPPGPKLGDLDWSAVLDPKPKKVSTPATSPFAPSPLPLSPGEERGFPTARCAGVCGKDGRVPLVIEGRLVKSRKVADTAFRGMLREGVVVSISDDDPPTVLSVSE